MKNLVVALILFAVGFLAWIFWKKSKNDQSGWSAVVSPATGYSVQNPLTGGYVPTVQPMNSNLSKTSPNVGAAVTGLAVTGGCVASTGQAAPCAMLGTVAAALEQVTVKAFSKGGIFGGSSKVCRCSANGKDVFPNDIEAAKQRYGISDCEQVGKLWNTTTKKWPWQ